MSMMNLTRREIEEVIASHCSPLLSLQQHTGALEPPIPNLQEDGNIRKKLFRQESIAYVQWRVECSYGRKYKGHEEERQS